MLKRLLPMNYTERNYIITGSIEVDHQTYKAGQMLVIKMELQLSMQKKNNFDALGGEPLGDRYIWWNLFRQEKKE
jgi:redox-sensitive bicupin YhaK (pirin superfamily)